MFNKTTNKIKYGYIATYFSDKGYGFICDNDEEDEYFFHISNLEHSFDIVPNKTKVVFTIKENQKGVYATNIKQHFPKIEGEFGYIPLPNKTIQLTNEGCYQYLKEQQPTILKVLEVFKKSGLSVNTNTNGWITMDLTPFEEIDNPTPKNGNWKEHVPSGYPDTFSNVIRLLQKQINHFNYSYNVAIKGYEGEQKTAHSLKAVSINYPVLHNVLLEEGNDSNRYSAETDTLIITDRAIFIIETKNYGGKGDILTISNDGRWELYDKYKKTSKIISKNPYKQCSDHVFVIKKFLENHTFNDTLPIIPIIAIANNNVDIKSDADNGLAKVLRTELIGTYILQYLDSHEAVISKKALSSLCDIFLNEKMPHEKYTVLDYCENIKTVCSVLVKLINYYSEDYEESVRIEIERKRIEEEKRKEEEAERLRKLQEEKKKQKEAKAERLRKLQEERRRREALQSSSSNSVITNNESEEKNSVGGFLGALVLQILKNSGFFD